MENECRAGEGDALAINFTPDIYTAGDPADFAGPDIGLTHFIGELLFEGIPGIEVFEIRGGIHLRTSFEAR